MTTGIQREFPYRDRAVKDPTAAGTQAQQRAERDRTVDLLAEVRKELVERAREIAVVLAKERGEITSPEVLYVLRCSGYGAEVDAVGSPVWMGAVFGPKRGWRRVGWKPLGHHGRHVSVWALTEGATTGGRERA